MSASGPRHAHGLIELFLIVAVALGLALGIQAFLVKPFRIPSESMVPTLDINQRVLVDRVSFHVSEPHRGDVVVFKPPRGADVNDCGVGHPNDQACPMPTPQPSGTNFIKRIVAEPGDRVSIRDGRVYIDGELQEEETRHIRGSADCALCDLPRPVTVPPEHFFMMGDNRGESADSREWGPVPKKWIIGNAFFTYWPPRRIGAL